MSESETIETAAKFAGNLKAGDFVLLLGPLGSGKTAFARGIAGVFGCAGEVRSPSFKIVNRYDGRIPVYHIDLYRLGGSAEAFDTGLEEIFTESAVFIVEWPEKIIDYFKKFYLVEFREISEKERRIIFFDCWK